MLAVGTVFLLVLIPLSKEYAAGGGRASELSALARVAQKANYYSYEIGMIAGDDMKAEIGGRIPLGQVATAEQVARMALYLASDDSDYSTGAEFVVDGGMTAGMGLGR